MRNRILLAISGVVLLLVGLAGGMLISGHFTAQAAAPQHYTVHSDGSKQGEYCALYEQTLANDLKVAPSALEAANIDALTKVLDEYVKDGQITKTERDQLVALIKQLGVSPCTQLNQKAIMQYLQGNPLIVQQALAAHAALNSAVAGALHMTPDALTTALGNHKTVAQLAKQQGVAISSVNTAYLNAAQSFLTQAVSSGTITQAQADGLNKMLTQAVAKGSYPLLDLGSLSSLGQGQ
ncbi:MAG TPA: hypothetical protein VF120_02390 [Ktedonobacterales bacterium]